MPAEKNPNFEKPDEPFTFINIFEIAEKDIDQFVSDWQSRSKIMGQMPGAITATLYKSVLPENKFQLVNVSLWQSYNAFLDATNDQTYAKRLSDDLDHTPSIKINRGFYRPVATTTHFY